MENLIQLHQGSKSYGSKLLFEGASFAVNECEHVGVIGPNGAGKTTLFRILTSEETLDSGRLILSRQLKLGYLSQHDAWKPQETVEDFITRDASLPIWELKSLGRSLGLTEDYYSRPIETLSGGYRMRAKLLHLIGKQPNLMLLDEPTNYLDLETLMVLEKFLQGYRGAFLLISHDREFLRRTTDHILEVESGDITKYNGNIDDYFEQKELLRNQLTARALSLEEKRKQVLDFVARFGAKATKASQAQSRLKSLNRMETIEIKPLPVQAKIRIPAPERTGKHVLNIQGMNLGYGEKTILSGVEMRLGGGEHLAVVGLNGAGKSTLLKALAGRLTPLCGSIDYGFGITLAFYNQHVAEELHATDTVVKALQRKAHPEVLPQEILDLAGSLLFSGNDVHKPIQVLSGGERSRVALGQILLQKASCLILDEPTNHMDFQTVEALTQALQSFAGSLVVVSHDRSFVRRIGTKILEVHRGKASFYPGSYDDYVWSLEKGAFNTLQSPQEDAAVSSSSSYSSQTSQKSESLTENLSDSSFNYKERKKSFDRRMRQLDTLLSKTDQNLADYHQKIQSLNEELSHATSGEAPAKIQEMGKFQRLIEESEAQWLSASEEREQLLAEAESLGFQMSPKAKV